MNPEENDALWKLLGKAGQAPKISPTFAQDVARKARQMGQPEGGFLQRLLSFEIGGGSSWVRPTAAFAALAAILITAVFLINDHTDALEVVEHPPVVPEVIAPEDPVLEVFEGEMEMIDQFDALLTVGDVDDLADEEIAMLLF